MKRILMVITRGEIGGAQNVVFTLAKGFYNSGYAVTVSTGPEHENALHNLCEQKGIKTHTFKNLSRSFSPIKAMLFMFEMWGYLKHNNFDVVHLHSSNTIFATIPIRLRKHSDIKILFTVHGLSLLDPAHKNIIHKVITKIIFYIFNPLINKIIFVSNNNYKQAQNIGLAKNGIIIYNGIEEQNFLNPDIAKKNLGTIIGTNLYESHLIGFIGRLAYPKNVEFIISNSKAIHNIIPNIHIIIIGDGPRRQFIISKINEHKVNDFVHIVGSLPNASMYMRAFSLFVLPSLYEGLSLTLIEAIHAGIPILCSNTGGNSEIVGEENIQLFPINDYKVFLEHALEILQKKEIRTSIYKNNIKRSKQFTSKQMVNNYINLFR